MVGVVAAAISVTLMSVVLVVVRRIGGGSDIGSMRGRDCGDDGVGC